MEPGLQRGWWLPELSQNINVYWLAMPSRQLKAGKKDFLLALCEMTPSENFGAYGGRLVVEALKTGSMA